MKYAILLCFLIMGCFSLKPYSTPEVVNYYGFDFTKYTAEGFLFTPLTYTGLYDSKGIVRVEVYPEVKIVKKQVKTSTSSYMEDMPIVSEVKVETLLDKAYQFARNLRSDAIIEVKIESVEILKGNVPVHGLRLDGFAILRKDY